MMNFDVFKKMIVVEMEQRVGVGHVAIERITKNNATKMNGLIIQENNRNMAPVINLDSFYKELREKPFPANRKRQADSGVCPALWQWGRQQARQPQFRLMSAKCPMKSVYGICSIFWSNITLL